MEFDTLFGGYPHSIDAILGSFQNQNFVNGFVIDTDFMLPPPEQPPLNTDSVPSPSSDGEYSSDDGTSSNPILKFIGEMLMEEEDLEAKPCMLQDCLALQAAEKSLYDILGQEYRPVDDPLLCFNQSQISPSSDSSPTNFIEFNRSQSQLDQNRPNGSRTKKNHRREEDGFNDSGERSNKQSAVSVPADEIDLKMFDEVLLCGGGDETERCFSDQKNTTHQFPKKPSGRGRRGKKNGAAATGAAAEAVDLWTLLIQCSQSVAGNDQRTSHDLLTQIRHHSSPRGDGLQRTAHFFANALEARLAGARAPAYSPLVSDRSSAAEILKAYQVYVSACPFKRMSHFYANRMILKQSENAKKLHIIDFGILYGYQWPCLIQRLSKRPGGPPAIKITGIELPQPGFRPAGRVEETGRRLHNYCKRFNVEFEYQVIAQKWETIKYEDLNIDRDNETIVVNSLYRLKNIPDETVAADSPRDAVLRLIRRVKPDLFVHGAVNGTYNAPFFVTRFREALFHFSALFDMFDTNITREDEQRMLFEREIFARDAMNAVACEGVERVERPETYKQWQVRNIRARLRPVALDKELFGSIKERVRCGYHKDFVVHEDGPWMLQGWKGRLIYAISCWRPA